MADENQKMAAVPDESRYRYRDLGRSSCRSRMIYHGDLGNKKDQQAGFINPKTPAK